MMHCHKCGGKYFRLTQHLLYCGKSAEERRSHFKNGTGRPRRSENLKEMKIRISVPLSQVIESAAEQHGQSVNQYIVDILEQKHPQEFRDSRKWTPFDGKCPECKTDLGFVDQGFLWNCVICDISGRFNVDQTMVMVTIR